MAEGEKRQRHMGEKQHSVFGKVARGLTESMSAECEGMGASKKHAWEGGSGPEEERQGLHAKELGPYPSDS